MVDDTDSLEILRASWSDGLRGGKAGETCVDGFLSGKRGGGGAAGLEDLLSASFAPVRTILVGGGRTPFLRGPAGSLPIPEARSRAFSGTPPVD